MDEEIHRQLDRAWRSLRYVSCRAPTAREVRTLTPEEAAQLLRRFNESFVKTEDEQP